MDFNVNSFMDIFNDVSLNFGLFSNLINQCRNEATASTQADVIAKLVYIVDPGNRCIDVNNSKLDNIDCILGYKDVVNHLVKGNRKFHLGSDFCQLLQDKEQLIDKMRKFITSYLDYGKILILTFA